MVLQIWERQSPVVSQQNDVLLSGGVANQKSRETMCISRSRNSRKRSGRAQETRGSCSRKCVWPAAVVIHQRLMPLMRRVSPKLWHVKPRFPAAAASGLELQEQWVLTHREEKLWYYLKNKVSATCSPFCYFNMQVEWPHKSTGCLQMSS